MSNVTRGIRFPKLSISGVEVVSVRWRMPVSQDYKDQLRKDPCPYCGKRKKLTSWEHVTPKSKKGKNGWQNIVRACMDCNHNRGNTPLLRFLFDIGGLK